MAPTVFFSYDVEVMFIVSIIFLVMPWIALLLRVYVRSVMIKAWGWDDTFMVLAVFCFSVESGIVTYIGCHLVGMDLAMISHMLKISLVSAEFYLITSIFFKISLGIFFLRFLQEPWQRRTVLVCTTIYTLVGIGFFILLTVQCGDPRSIGSNIMAKHCGRWAILRPVNYLYATINALTDWVFALIPIMTIRKLNMPRPAKISASILLGLGAAASIASVVRMKFIEGLNVNVQLFPSPAIATTSCIEMGLGMTAACCATLRPLFGPCLGRARDTLLKTTGLRSKVSANTPAASAARTADWSKKNGTEGTFASYGFAKSSVMSVMESTVEVEEKDGEMRVTGHTQTVSVPTKIEEIA